MKKFLGILVLGLMLVSSPVNSGQIGSGEITLSQGPVNAWMEYIKGGLNQKNPDVFLITTDGKNSFYYYCNYAQCAPGNNFLDIQACERRFKGKECKIFARRRTIKWHNDINTGNKKSKFNSKMSDAEVKAKLTELGFLGGTTSTTTTSDETKYPKSLFPADSYKKEQWDEFKKYDESKEWPFSVWAEIRSKKDAYNYQWGARKTLKEAIKYAMDKCDERRKEGKNKYKKSEICIVHYLNGKETTDDEKIKYAEEYYGKELASKSFKRNSWILKKKSSLKKTKIEKKKKKKENDDIVKSLKDLQELYESGALTKEEYTKAKEKLLN